MIMRVLKTLGVLLVLASLALVAGTVVPRPLWTDPATAGGDATREILVLSNPIHTDIAIPVDPDLIARFGFLAKDGLDFDDPAIRYLVFGWGGRAFYIETPEWSQLKPLPVLKALTVDRSVMHVERAGAINRTHPAVMPFEIDDTGYENLLRFIEESFERDAAGPVFIPGTAYGENDVFFEARGRFNAFVGCNTWTSAALRAAGLRTGWWNPLPVTLATSLGLHNDLPER